MSFSRVLLLRPSLACSFGNLRPTRTGLQREMGDLRENAAGRRRASAADPRRRPTRGDQSRMDTILVSLGTQPPCQVELGEGRRRDSPGHAKAPGRTSAWGPLSLPCSWLRLVNPRECGCPRIQCPHAAARPGPRSGAKNEKAQPPVIPRGCAYPQMVEAAGIEPASENASYETTTCVVDLFYRHLVRTSSDRQDPGWTSPEDSPAAPGRRPSASLL